MRHNPEGPPGHTARPLRILNLARIRWWSALAHYAHATAVALARRGHDVLCAGDPGTPFVDRCHDAGLPILD
ncbi:MAG: hypothetical protein GF355_08225, partial [Candidatus Eisenbacteria bacterium]|nr:hypothetical protein [Candidatus Eisenbacteria bacterium]